MYTRIKSPEEIALMRKSGQILARTLKLLEKEVKPGVTTKKLADIAHKEILKSGAKPAFLGYGHPYPFPDVICISLNEEVVHGIPDQKTVLKDGDLVSLDLGVDYKGMITDSAVTVACGDVGPEVSKFISDTKKALSLGLKQVKNGCQTGDIGYAVQTFLEKNGYGVVRDLVGHGVGHEVHEDPNIPNFGKKRSGHRLVSGMTVAIEPMSTIGNYAVHIDPHDHWTVKTNDGSLSAHFEHTILVTDNGFEVLTTL